MNIFFRAVLVLSCAVVSLRGASKLDFVALIREADAVILYSLEPNPAVQAFDEHGNPVEKGRKRELLHGYPVLGKIAKPDAKTAAAIRRAFVAALTNTSEEYRAPSLCFDPRHALCLRQNDTHVDLLICFACGTGFAFYFAGDEWRKDPIGVSEAGQAELNAVLDARRIPRDVPKKSEPPAKSFEVR